METAHGFAAPAVSALARGIREYSLFQAVLLVMDRLREEYPSLGDEALYDQLEFQANPSLGFPGSDVCLLYTSPSPRDYNTSRMPSSA